MRALFRVGSPLRITPSLKLGLVLAPQAALSNSVPIPEPRIAIVDTDAGYLSRLAIGAHAFRHAKRKKIADRNQPLTLALSRKARGTAESGILHPQWRQTKLATAGKFKRSFGWEGRPLRSFGLAVVIVLGARPALASGRRGVKIPISSSRSRARRS